MGLKKGESIEIKSVSGSALRRIRVCLGWKTPQELDYDLDASCFLLNEEGKCRDIHDLVCFGSILKRPKLDENGNIIFKKMVRVGENGQKEYLDWPICEFLSRCQSVVHLGDIIAGQGEDDEQIMVNLERLPAYVRKLVFVVTIYEYNSRKNLQGNYGQSFMDIEGTYARVLNETGKRNVELQGSRFDLSKEDASAMRVCEIYRTPGNVWKFKALGEGLTKTSLEDLYVEYGLPHPDEVDFSDFTEVEE